jgi:hypothetical protein
MKKSSMKWITVFFFVILFFAGLLVYKDYGIPWDEPTQVQVASLNHRYIFHHDPALLSFTDRYYGVMFELPYFWITSHLLIPRHLLIFLTFFAGLVVFYFLAKRLLRNQGWALLACVLLVSSPRLFADSFYNSKDIPFMVITIIGISVLLLASDYFRKAPGWLLSVLWAGILSLISAAMIDTRITGILIIPLCVFVFIIELIRRPGFGLKWLVIFGVYLGATIALVVLFWPVLWQDPWAGFLNAFRKMSQYPLINTVLYMGKAFKAAQLPWHYLPVWIGITTPLIILAGFLPGIIGWIQSILNAWQEKKRQENISASFMNQGLQDWVIVFLWLAIPVAAIYIFHSVIYDGWRQMFFIYPAILLFSLLGLRTIYQTLLSHIHHKTVIQVLCGLILFAGIAEPVLFMVRNHPYENVYFNTLSGNPATLRSRFELDYWGLSYKQAVDYVLANDPRPFLKVSMANPSGKGYVDEALSAPQKSRLKFTTDPSEADYFFTEFRWHPQDYPYADEYYSIRVQGMVIMAVYRLH